MPRIQCSYCGLPFTVRKVEPGRAVFCCSGCALASRLPAPGAGNLSNFGSAHANGFQMAFCDGSVQMMSYSIDNNIHRCLCNRKDGTALDGKKF